MDKCRVESETNEYLESLKTVDYHEKVEEVLKDTDMFLEVELSEDTLIALFNYMNGNESNLPTEVYNDIYRHVGGEV